MAVAHAQLLMHSRDSRMATVKGGGGEQFELLLVLINELEEPSDLVWL
jgi:hypothetical protein